MAFMKLQIKTRMRVKQQRTHKCTMRIKKKMRSCPHDIRSENDSS